MSSGQLLGVDLRIQIEGLRLAARTHLITHGEEIQRTVDDHVTALVSSGELDRMIREQITKEVKTALDDAIKSAVRHAFWDPQARAGLTALIVGQLEHNMDEG